MTDEQFDILTTKVLAGEATAEDSARLEALLAQDPKRRAEFDELKAAWTALREYGPLTRSLEAPPAPFPEYRLRELQGAVQKHFSGKAREQPESLHMNLGVAASRQSAAHSRWTMGRRSAETPLRFWDSTRELVRQNLSLFELLRLWFQSPRVLAVAATAVVLILGLMLAMRPGREKAGETVGYLLASQGQPEVMRNGKPMSVNAVTSLRPGDEIRLIAGAAGTVITPSGSLLIKGPQRLAAEKLSTLVGSTPDSTPRPAGRNVTTALFGSIKQVLGTPILAVMRDTQGIALYSPREATLNLTPLILWKAGPGKTYDLTITDEFDRGAPPWQLRVVVPPVDFWKVEAWKDRPLTSDGLYRIIIRETGNPLSVGEYTFRTRKEADTPRSADHRIGTPATSPAEKIARAYQLLDTESPCPGDALAELMTLPPEFAESELVLRLKLALFGQLGLQEEYDATAAKLQPPSNPRTPQ